MDLDVEGNEEVHALMAEYPELPTALAEVAAIHAEVNAEEYMDFPSTLPRIDFDSGSEDEGDETECPDHPVSFKADWDPKEFKIDFSGCQVPGAKEFTKETLIQLVGWINCKLPAEVGYVRSEMEEVDVMKFVMQKPMCPKKDGSTACPTMMDTVEPESSSCQDIKQEEVKKAFEPRNQKIVILSRTNDPPWTGTIVQLAGSWENAYNPKFGPNTSAVDMVVWALMQGKQYNRFAIRYQIEESEFATEDSDDESP